MKRVLLIGDSIRMFCQGEVIKQLGEEFTVAAPDENCRFSAYVLNSLRHWLPQFGPVDVIQFNAGLWDTAILYPEDGCFIGLKEYVSNMTKILRELKKSGAKLIFRTSTPVSDKKANLPGPMPPAARNEDIMRYNQAVLEAFAGEDLVINDLFSLVYPRREELLLDDMVHPNETGVKLIGGAMAQVIRQVAEHADNQAQNASDYIKLEEKVIQ